MSIIKRIDNITNIPAKYLTEIPPSPKSVKVELTGRCNLQCEFCATGKKLRKIGEIDKQFYKKLVLELVDIGVQELGLFYLGESFLCKWLPEAIEFAKKAGMSYVFLTTNGVLSTSERVRSCLESGLDSLKFSYNYCNEDQFSKVTKAKPKQFCEMQENIKSAWKIRKELKSTCGLYASYIQYNDE